MIGPAALEDAVAGGLAAVSAEPDVIEAQVFASALRTLLARLNYTSHMPSNGVEEPKSSEVLGVGVQLVLRGGDGLQVGFGAETGDLSPAGVARAAARARLGAVVDPDFSSLPRDPGGPPAPPGHADPALLGVGDEELVAAGWRVVDEGLRRFLGSSRLAGFGGDEAGLRGLGLILGGDVTMREERMAIASTAMPLPRRDEFGVVTASVTAMIEAFEAKGTSSAAATRLADFTGEAGADAAGAAIAAIGGERVADGEYAVIFGPQPMADLLDNLLIPACRADSFRASNTPFLGGLGRPVASSFLSVHDDGARAGLAMSRSITCEGLPTGRTDLIRDGVLVGLLASWYEAQRLLRDPGLPGKLGVGPSAAGSALVARNGFRLASGGGARAFDAAPSIAASNVMVEGAPALSRDELLDRVGHGLYVGRIWYTYPVNGLRAGDFTCTVVGDSYRIRDGRLASPLRANAIRINDNIGRLLRHVIGVGSAVKATPGWASEGIVYAPDVAVSGVPVEAIARSGED